MPYADPVRAREAARERYARCKQDPECVARKREQRMASYYRNLEANRAKKRDAIKRYKYGLSQSELEALLTRAEGRCELCGRESEKLNIDHNHETGRVRGILCSGCNAALHWVEHPGWWAEAQAYLEARDA